MQLKKSAVAMSTLGMIDEAAKEAASDAPAAPKEGETDGTCPVDVRLKRPDTRVSTHGTESHEAYLDVLVRIFC